MNVTPTLQAKRILAAWESGDEPLLHQELRKSQKLDYAIVHGLDEERMELLQAVSQGMLQAVSQDRRDPAVRPCLDLLAHLARRHSYLNGN